MTRRNTIQRDLVLNAINTLKSHATAEEIYDMISKTYPSIGKATVYRNLSILVDEGLVKKVEMPGICDRYDHYTKEHYHVKCIKCGKIFDVDLDNSKIPNLKNCINDDHGIIYLDYDIVFSGICSNCQKELN